MRVGDICAEVAQVNTSKPWTPADTEAVRANYPETCTNKLAAQLGRTRSAVFQKARIIGVYKTIEYIRREVYPARKGMKNAGAFKPGFTPYNKGKKGVNGSSCTTFKPGNRPATAKPVGAHRIIDGFEWEKIAEPNQWVALHKRAWEAAHGPIPKGMTLCFRDGNGMNPALDNLELLTRAELMERNTYHRYPPELKANIKLLKKLEREIHEYK